MPNAKTAFDGGLPKTLDPLLIVECTSDCVLTVDRDWRFTYLNQRCLELISNGKHLLGKVLWDEFPQIEHTLFERSRQGEFAPKLKIITHRSTRGFQRRSSGSPMASALLFATPLCGTLKTNFSAPTKGASAICLKR